MAELYIHYQNQKQPFDLPPKWRLLTFAELPERSGQRDVVSRTRQVLQSPVGHAALGRCLSSSDKVAILIEDPSRASPKQLVLKALLKELKTVPLQNNQIVVVIALGTHRRISREEMGRVYGKDLLEQYTFINHDCNAPDLVPMGRLKSGTWVKINPKVQEANFKIGIGSIFPHPLNGFGGGSKILFPAVADFDAILEHHLKYAFRDGSRTGNLDGNPFYEEICSLSEVGGLNFIINSVLDHNDKLYDLICGDPIQAHRVGTGICRCILTVNFPKKADITIVSAFPYSEGTQIMKPLGLAADLTTPGGVIILTADCTVPLQEDYVAGCESFRQKHAGYLEKAVFEHFSQNRRIMETGAPEFNMSLAQALLTQHHFNVILVSEDISRNTVERLGFLHATNLDHAFSLAREICPSGDVHVLPSGGMILPDIPLKE